MSTTKKATSTLKNDFLEAYSNLGSFREAAAIVGVTPRTITRWRADDEAFAEEILATRGVLVEALASSLYQRALEGDTTGAIYLLKCWDPSTYNRSPQPAPIAAGDEQRPQITVEVIEPSGVRTEFMRRLNEQRDRLEAMTAP